jgi:hypothetical protein
MKFIKPEHTAFNVWLSLLDELVDKGQPMGNAMVYSGKRLQQKQEEYRKTHGDYLFDPIDLYAATETINLLLRRRPEYTQRQAGWAKERID